MRLFFFTCRERSAYVAFIEMYVAHMFFFECLSKGPSQYACV